MTISYSREVATTKVGTFARLLFRWKGSIYRLLYREMLLFLLMYYFICVMYHMAFTEHIKRKFEEWASFCQKYADFVPLTFVLGFYVSIIVGRWWNIFTSINWPDRMCLQIQTFVVGDDERGRMIRRSAARYINLSQVLVLRDISSAVKKRFPTLEHLIECGFLTEDEYKQFENIEMSHHKFWVPLQWACSLLYKARKEARIEADPTLVKMIDEILTTRNNLANLLCYDWISVPLVYTQVTICCHLIFLVVVTIAVYSYFLACLFGRQYLIESSDESGKHYRGHEMDMYFPLFTVLQFIFYMGWLKVAESIMNPLGEDDDDFEVNYLIERNLQVSYCIVDENWMKIPPLKRDIHWNEPEASVPHTQASAGLKSNPPVLSASAVEVTAQDAEIQPAPSIISLATNPDGANRKKSSVCQNGQMQRKLSNRDSTKQNFRRLMSNVSNRLSRGDMRASALLEDGHNETTLHLLCNADADVPPTGISPSPSPSSLSSQTPFSERNFSVSNTNKSKLAPVCEVVNEENDSSILVESDSNNLIELATPEDIASIPQVDALEDVIYIDKDVEYILSTTEDVDIEQRRKTINDK